MGATKTLDPAVITLFVPSWVKTMGASPTTRSAVSYRELWDDSAAMTYIEVGSKNTGGMKVNHEIDAQLLEWLGLPLAACGASLGT
jgi:hypothetical protein